MKILILTNSIVGLYRFRKELLYKFIENKHEVVVSCPNDDPKDYVLSLKNNGIEYLETFVDRRGINPLKDLKLLKNYLNIIKIQDPDYVLTYTIKPNIYGSLASKLLRKKYINNVTGLGTSLQQDSLLSKILKKMYKVSFSKSKCVFFQNQINMNFFLKNKILFSNEQNIKLIPGSGVNLEAFYPREKSLVDKKIRFLYIGRLMDEKGLKEYLECAKNIKEKNKNVEFQILGPFEEKKYEEIIKKLEEKNIVNYLGVSTDIREQVKEVDCIINPSWHEGMSNVLLESGAMKKFLIASEIPGCKEIVINNKTGLTFKVKNEKSLEEEILKYLKLDEVEKENIIENCYEHIKNNFSREKVIEEYMKVIKEGGEIVVR
ncbi:glycosyltransferase family 4 protein [uncultured Cetobacterium sp.]|uniref:glycosyltransferase family 4 protein n=1 Tax=uncultured Cetobacterium sp. TaxID=527638 RepID=UPI00261855D3|nr:glycosyltransferase family 4 protein [uncultured Cetobacterium sp.]